MFVSLSLYSLSLTNYSTNESTDNNTNNVNSSRLAVLTLCACTPPLDEVLQLWDFLLAFGVHLNVLCIIAQLLLIREDLMISTR